MQKLNDLSRSLAVLEPDVTLIAVIEMSLSSWLVAGIVPGVERQPLKKLSVDESALLKLLQRWREEAELTDTVEKDFEGATSATLIQGEHRTSAAAHEIRDGDQPQDREGARPYCAANAARPRRRGDRVRRREFIAALGGAAAWPLAASAQQPAMPVIGYLHAGSFDGYINHAVAFRQGLNEVGFVPGQNVAIEFRWAATQYDWLPALAAELVERKVAVLYAGGGSLSVRAARAASATIPIVFTTGGDPIETGLVISLNRPDGNTTGISFVSRALGPKRLELIRELLPKATTIAVLHNPQNPLSPAELTALHAAANTLGQKLRILSASTVAEIDQVFVELGQQRPDALLIGVDLLFFSQRQLIVALTACLGIPTMYPADDFIRAGGLVSYGASSPAATWL